MTPTLAAAPPRQAFRFPMLSLWWLTLLPGSAVVLLDLHRGVVRPGTWAARFGPALLVLAVLLWAQLRTTPLALRLRQEFRLTLGGGLLLSISSGAALCLDALPEGPAHELVWTLPWTLAVMMPTSAVLMPMTFEREQGTLFSLLTTPLGGRAFAEKFALAAGLVVLSWLQLSAGEQRGSELWWFALGGHLLALATAPTWFFLVQDGGNSLGFILITPFVVAAPVALLLPSAVIPTAGLYLVVMLWLLPAAVRRGAAAGVPGWLRTDTPGFSWLEKWARPVFGAQLREQRDAVVLGSFGILGLMVIELTGVLGGSDVAELVLLFPCAAAAVLSPCLAFTEARRLGTLDAELVVQPRRVVFTRRALVSALTTLVVSVLAPSAYLAATWRFSLTDAGGWALVMGFIWAVGLAVSVHLDSVWTALVSGLGLALALPAAQFGLLLLALQPASGRLLMGTVLVVVACAALAVAGRRFNAADRLEPRVLLLASAVSFGAAYLLNVII